MSQTTITLNAVAYPSYATAAEADTYLAVEPAYMATWAKVSADTKAAYLIAATRRLDALPWAGQKASATQAAEWPRADLTDANGDAVPSNTVPIQIEYATILLAAAIATDPTAFDSSTTDDDIQSERIGPKAVTYFHRQRSRLEQQLGSRRLVNLLRPWLASAVPSRPLVTGTGDKSSFVPLDRYGRSEGTA